MKGTWWFLAAATGHGRVRRDRRVDEAGNPTPSPEASAWVASPFAALPTQLALLALAFTAVTADYATAGIVPTLQWTPRRTILFIARVLVVVGTASVLGMLLRWIASAAFLAARTILTLPLGEGVDVGRRPSGSCSRGRRAGRRPWFRAAEYGGRADLVFLLMLLLPLVLPQFGYEWMDRLRILPGTGAVFLLTGEPTDRGFTETASVLIMITWAVGTLLLGWARLIRNDASE